MIAKISSSVLILFIVFMGIKQGLAMTTGKLEMVEMFGEWGFGKTGVMIFGFITLLATLLIVVPRTFVWGNFLMAATILLIICFQLSNSNIKGGIIELPFLLLNLIVLYLKHPLSN